MFSGARGTDIAADLLELNKCEIQQDSNICADCEKMCFVRINQHIA